MLNQSPHSTEPDCKHHPGRARGRLRINRVWTVNHQLLTQ